MTIQTVDVQLRVQAQLIGLLKELETALPLIVRANSNEHMGQVGVFSLNGGARIDQMCNIHIAVHAIDGVAYIIRVKLIGRNTTVELLQHGANIAAATRVAGHSKQRSFQVDAPFVRVVFHYAHGTLHIHDNIIIIVGCDTTLKQEAVVA